MQKCGISDDDAKRYAETFVTEKMDELILPDLDRDILKGLGVTEGDIIRIRKNTPKKDGIFLTAPQISAPVAQAISDKERAAQMRNLAMLDQKLATKVQGQETASSLNKGYNSEQIKADEDYARRLQEEELGKGSGKNAASRRRGTF